MDQPRPDPAEDRAAVTAAWHAYLDPAPSFAVHPAPLPQPAGLDLGPFLRDVIPGTRGEPWTGRTRMLTEHFRQIEPEFQGLPRLAHLTACTILSLRRCPDNPLARPLFWKILTEAGVDLAMHLDSRWLTSVCDTVVDTAERDVDRALGLTGTLFVSTIKMAETELRLYRPQRPWPPRTRLRSGGTVYDGVQTLWTEGAGDVDNIFARIERGLRIDSPVRPIVEALIFRAFDGNTFIKRIIGTTGEKRLPIAPAEKLAALREIMRGL